jgi:hypothetical protein
MLNPIGNQILHSPSKNPSFQRRPKRGHKTFMAAAKKREAEKQALAE